MTSLIKYIAYGLLFLWTFISLIQFVTSDETKTASKIKKLQIGVKKRVENCETKSKKGDVLYMHYKVCMSLFLF